MLTRHAAILLALTATAPVAGAAELGTVTLEPLGYAVYPLPTRGAEVAYQLTPEDAVSLSFAKGAAAQLLVDYDVTLLLVRYRRAIGSLSRANFGLGTRALAESSSTGTARQTALVAESSFGSNYDWGPALLACDWIGIVYPVSTLSHASAYASDADAGDVALDRANFDHLTHKPTLELLRLSVGVQF
jgi:hypothetical protein